MAKDVVVIESARLEDALPVQRILPRHDVNFIVAATLRSLFEKAPPR